ncbi:MAG: hypothetical protein C5B49_02655 [Bdellovibrio sp.]|nr:MAG: hypothetical protein C5B49_02655 [Bdellovibrio sp.]
MKHQKAKKVKGEEKSFLPEEAVRFLDDLRTLSGQIDEPTIAISLRVPANVLRAVKSKARLNGQKYQSLIVRYIRRGLQEK